MVHAAIDTRRARTRSAGRNEALLDAVAPGLGPERRAVWGEVLAALEELTVEQRAAFVLREVEGFTLKEAAQAMGCTEGAVEQRVLRAWTTLRRRLGDG